MKYKKLSEEERNELQNIQDLLDSTEEETRLLAISLLNIYDVAWFDTSNCRTLKEIATMEYERKKYWDDLCLTKYYIQLILNLGGYYEYENNTGRI